MAIKKDKKKFGSELILGKGGSKFDSSPVYPTDSFYGGGGPPEQTAQTAQQAKPEDTSDGRTYSRKSIAEGMKKLSKQGKLTPERVEEARGRASDLGVTGEQFDKFSQREDLNVLASSPMEAAARVAYADEFGSGLESLKARQDPNYELGSASPMSKGRLLNPSKGSSLMRMARRARKKGFGKAAEALYMQGALAKSREPNIITEDYRKQQMDQRIQMASEAAKQDKALAGFSEYMKSLRA